MSLHDGAVGGTQAAAGASAAASTAAAGSYDVAVVGCGLSGLSAARRVLRERPGARVVLVEARERVGGRTQVADSGHGTYVDLGGAYVGPTQDAVLRVAGEMGVETYPVFSTGDIMFKDPHAERVGRGTVAQPALLSAWELLDFNAALCRFDALAFSTVLDVSRPDLATEAERLDHLSVREWSRRHIQTARIRDTFPVILDTLLCKPSDEVSMLYYLWYARSGDSLKRLMDIENGAQERKFVGGSASISVKLAEELRAAGARLELNWPVRSVEQLAGGAVRLTCRDGRSVHAKTAIVALAPSLYRSIAWSPALPAGKQELGEAFSMGSIVKTVTYYAEPWWRGKGLSGQIFSVQGPIVYTMDDTKPDGTFPALMGFLLSTHAREWAAKSREERQLAITRQYCDLLQDERALHPVHYVEKDWNAEEFSGGCYVASPKLGSFRAAVQSLRSAHGAVLFAGTETAVQWAGYMDGAVRAGERAAKQAVARLDGVPDTHIDSIGEDPETPSRVLVARAARPTLLERGLALLFAALQRLRHPQLWWAPQQEHAN